MAAMSLRNLGAGALWLLVGGLAAAAFATPIHAQQDGAYSALPPPPEGECYEWQRKDEDGNCQDDPSLHVEPGSYQPGPNETCWVITSCLCEEGQSPGGQSCAPCSYAGESAYCVGR